MKWLRYTTYLFAPAALYVSAMAASPLTVTVDSLVSGKPIAPQFALCKPTAEGKSTKGENLRPTIAWSGAPANTKSFAVVVSDPDVPADFSKAGKDGMVVASAAPRRPLYHWVVTDIPANTTKIPGGQASATLDSGVAHLNDLGSYVPDAHQYGGPCPPWNDERIHHYHFIVYALDVPSLGLGSNATAKEVVNALTSGPHTLAQGEVVGTYTLNKTVSK